MFSNILFTVCTLLFIMSSVVLVLVILIQKPQGGGLSAAFGAGGGGASQTAFGTKTGDMLTIGTVGVFIFFIFISIVLVLMTTARYSAVEPHLPEAASGMAFGDVTSTAVQLSWVDESDNELQFEIQRSADAEGPFETISTVTEDIEEYFDTSVSAESTYFYQVIASNEIGASDPTDVIEVATPAGLDLPADPAEGDTPTGASEGSDDTSGDEENSTGGDDDVPPPTDNPEDGG